ncbi:hypothetical protein [Brevundimonas sp.]|uniref:hypothetical protein n=1 Tax=Brevundimonas sp. TaxID=1871086 RepID=UPI00289E80F1|nr:hypothetical protein [Brevundimonas sp.]
MAAAAKKTDITGAELVNDAARRALADAGGDVREAARMLEIAARSTLPLRDALTDALVAGACWDAVNGQVRKERQRIWSAPRAVEAAPNRQSQEQASRVVHLASGTLKMFPLPGGKRLGEATRSEIAAAAGFYERQAGDMAHKARWLQLVAQSVPEGKTAGQALTDERLAELQAEVRDAQ